MKKKSINSLIILIIICLLPLLPWYFLSPVKDLTFNYENLTHSLGQIAALIGMTMFAITFVLSTRLKFIEKFLGGLDKVYTIHRIFGSISFMLLLFHPIMLVLKFVPYKMDLAAKYLLPGHGISVNFGIIALGGMIILLIATFFINLKYHYWKISHKFMGIFFILAIFHIFLVRGTASRDYIFTGYYVYAIIVSVIGVVAFIYSLFFKSSKLAIYKIKSIKIINKIIFDIKLKPVNKPLNYKAGQFAFFRFHNKMINKEFHPFSIASPSDEPNIRIIIKSLGDYTNKLTCLKEDDIVSVEGPYGEFTIQNNDDDMIWICAGIGVTPFMGMAKDIIKKGYSSKINLYYIARNEEDFVGLDELNLIKTELNSKKSNENKLITNKSGINKTNVKFIVNPWISSVKGRITINDIQIINNAKIFLCGPEEFKKSLIKDLVKKGISYENIYQEDFNFK